MIRSKVEAVAVLNSFLKDAQFGTVHGLLDQSEFIDDVMGLGAGRFKDVSKTTFVSDSLQDLGVILGTAHSISERETVMCPAEGARIQAALLKLADSANKVNEILTKMRENKDHNHHDKV